MQREALARALGQLFPDVERHQGRSGNRTPPLLMALITSRRHAGDLHARQLGPGPSVVQQVQGSDRQAEIERVERHHPAVGAVASQQLGVFGGAAQVGARQREHLGAGLASQRQIAPLLGAVGLRVLEDVHQLQRLAELDGARAQIAGHALQRRALQA